MKNNDKQALIKSAVVGLFIAGIILILNYVTKGKNLIFNNLVQGEVLAGIVIALPTLWTWRENKRNTVSDNIRDTVKYYDKQLFDIVDNISKTKQLPFSKAGKIEYIVNTYNNLLAEWRENSGLDISLDFVQVLPVICSIEYPEGIEEPGNEAAENWKENLETALKPVLKEVIALEKQSVLRSKEIKYFSLITFGSLEYNFRNFEFIDKHFVQCTFSSSFIEANQFEKCVFINCSIVDNMLSTSSKEKLQNNIIKGDFEGIEEEDLVSSEVKDDSIVKGRYGRIYDAREGIVVDDFIMQGQFFAISSNSEVRSEIYQDIIKGLNHLGLGIDDKVNNKKISISKNYITDENKSNFIKNSLFSGWHSLFREKIVNQNNFKYFIFCIKVGNIYNTIVFEKENFNKFLDKKDLDKTEKYNFYFNGFEN
ncbi:hypothetical protein MKL26_08145 [Streptococcus suis]|nr:hypothetical protein [Streptococcus suis]